MEPEKENNKCDFEELNIILFPLFLLFYPCYLLVKDGEDGLVSPP
jgi:hypothetical protein